METVLLASGHIIFRARHQLQKVFGRDGQGSNRVLTISSLDRAVAFSV